MILLDTHIIVWDALDTKQLSETAKKAIADADQANALLICDISLWEIAMLIKKKRIQVNEPPANLLRMIVDARSYKIRGISPDVAELSVNLGDEINKDPADRLIAATAIIEKAPLLTADKNLQSAPSVNTVW